MSGRRSLAEARQEAADVERDQRAQEGRESASRARPAVVEDYLRVRHPDTGKSVVFVPGETLPDWARDAPALADAPRPAKGRGRAGGRVPDGEGSVPSSDDGT